MPRPRTIATATAAAQVRRGLGLSQQQLADWLGVAVSFAHAVESGRKPLPPVLAGRLVVLARLLPPPLGSGPPAAPPLLLPALPTLAWPPLPPGPALAPGPLVTAARTARLAALRAEAELLRRHTRARALAQQRQGLARLQAAPLPAEATEAARWPAWLAALAADLAAADPDPAREAALRQALAIRAAARRAEAEALEQAARPGPASG
jgi:hypothetical protein